MLGGIAGFVGQQYDVKLIFRRKFRKLGGLVLGHAVDGAIERSEIRRQCGEIFGFVRATRRVRLGVEIEHQRTFERRQIDRIACAIRNGDVGQGVVDIGHVGFLFKNRVVQIAAAIRS